MECLVLTFSITSGISSLKNLAKMSLTSSLSPPVASPPPPVGNRPISSNILVIARDDSAANEASSGLNAQGIPFTSLIVPQNGVDLPELNSTSGGNFGGIIVSNEVSYDYGGEKSFRSALTDDQWNQLYAYQLEYGVRMFQQNVYPGPKYGAKAVGGGCCENGVEQSLSFTDVSAFLSAGLKPGAGVSTQGLYHYPATISDPKTTKEIAQFDKNSVNPDKTTAGVISNFDGRQQMAFFISTNSTWSETSRFIQHASVGWLTRGLHAGHRRVNLNTQVDDMFLESDIYNSNGGKFRITAADMNGIVDWLPSINAMMNPGSNYFIEIGHNGNGNIEASTATKHGQGVCHAEGIEYDSPPDTKMEFKKPKGAGTDLWPPKIGTYNWSSSCSQLDDLLLWWTDETNRDKFAHVSHTFTHLELNNATASDASKEISFNQEWMKTVGLSSAKHFTYKGIIPPAITGLHNGDALKAWWDNGIRNCVGDNSRPKLVNQENEMWPYLTTVESDGFDGMQVNPRWVTRIYYNCNSPECNVQEWKDIAGGSGNFNDLLAAEKRTTMHHLFGLSAAPFMFHQANLRNADVEPMIVNGKKGKYSIFQAWVETQVQEFTRLVDWPLVTTTHQEVCVYVYRNYDHVKLTSMLDVRCIPRSL